MEQNNIWGSFLCLKRTVCVHNYWKNLFWGHFLIVEFLVILFGGFLTVFQGIGYHLTRLVVEVCGREIHRDPTQQSAAQNKF